MKSKYCPDCWPTKRKSHAVLHLEYYIERYFISIVKKLDKILPKRKQKPDKSWGIFLEILSLLKIVKFIDNPDEKRLLNRSLIFFKEAKNRNIDIKAVKLLNNYIDEYKFKYKGKKYYYQGNPFYIYPAKHNIDDKNYIKTILGKNDIPIAQGSVFLGVKKALNYGKRLDFPLVVKPNAGSLSHHITCDIKTEQELYSAIIKAKKYRPDVIVERFVKGDLYRATVIGKKEVFVCKKERANIIGDGKLSIEELIQIKNSEKDRGETHQKNCTLHIIPIDNVLIKNLEKQNLTLQSILAEQKKFYLQEKYVLSHGCDIINCTDQIHTDNKELFLQIAQLLKTDLVGIDFICYNINESYKTQKGAVLETNSLPYLDMHQYPSHGKSEEIAKTVWDMILNKIN